MRIRSEKEWERGWRGEKDEAKMRGEREREGERGKKKEEEKEKKEKENDKEQAFVDSVKWLSFQRIS
jgi:hypothetical protein